MNKIIAALLIVLIVLILYLVYRGKRTIEQWSIAFFGTKSLKKGMEKQMDLLSETPKSVSGMTKICLPQIQRDFPGFNYTEMKANAENTILSYFRAISESDPSCLTISSEELKEAVKLQIQDNRLQKKHKIYSGVTIHKTEISRYLKEKGLCKIILESALEYYYKETDEAGHVIDDNHGRKIQTKYVSDLAYVQNIEEVGEDKNHISLSCPNCGAPVSRLGAKYCEYCSTLLEEIQVRVWKILTVEEKL